MKERILKEENAVLRHSAVERAEHWLIAVSGLVLLFSGFGEFPMYKRYMVTDIPGLSWAGNFWIHLKIHYLAAIVFVGAAVFHAVYHGVLGHRGLLPRKGDGRASLTTVLSFIGIGEEPPSGKYLPEQRLAYAYIAAVSLILILTGLIKVTKNLAFVYLPPALITAATLTHTAATFLFLFGFIAHLAALALKVNWPLIKPMFTGRVDLDYVRHRHSIWYDEMIRDLPQEPEKEEKTEPAEESPAEGAGESIGEKVSVEQQAGGEPGPEASPSPPETEGKSESGKPGSS